MDDLTDKDRTAVEGEMMSTETYHWIAINGSSVALSPYALPVTVNVNPIPRFGLWKPHGNSTIFC